MIQSITRRAQNIARFARTYPPSRNLRSTAHQSISSSAQAHRETLSQSQSRFKSSSIPHRILRLPSKKPRRISKGLWTLISSLRITFIGRPSIIQEETAGMPKAAYYAVAVGQRPGIYDTWAEAEQQVKGYPAAKYKKFSTSSEAEEYMSSNTSRSSSSSISQATASKFTRIHPSSSTSTSTSTSISEPFQTHRRAESPTTESSHTSLPENLQQIASKGYKFTKEPFYLIVHTDGSALGNGQVGSRAGAGVYWGGEEEAWAKRYSERVPGLPQTNNRGELLAVIRAIEQCPYPDVPLEIRCDSQYTINCMTTWLPKWLKTNFQTSSRSYSRPNGSVTANTSKQVSNVDMIKHLLVLLRRRGSKGKVKFKYVPAHSGVEGNERADQLAKAGSMMPESNTPVRWLNPDDEPDYPYSRTGAGKGQDGITDIEVEMDESWLMSPEELDSFEKDLID